MIESWYWKQELLAHAKRLEPVAVPKRWSERAVVAFEKDLMISFFMVRALLERHKLSKRVTNYRVPLQYHPWNGKAVTSLNHFSLEDLYDLETTRQKSVSVGFLANQFIHALTIFSSRDKSRNWANVGLCSDYEKQKALYLVAVPDIQAAFRLVGRDAVESAHYTFNESKQDFDVDLN